MERLLFRKVEVWVLGLLVILGLLGTMAFGWLVFHRLSGGHRFGPAAEAAVAIARFPSLAESVLTRDIRLDDHEVDTRFAEPAGFTFMGEIENPQYVLVSRYDGNRHWSVVELYKEGEAEPRHSWVFDDAEKLDFESDNPFILHPDQSRSHTLWMVHPWLSPEGLLTLHVHFGAQYQFDACGEPVWRNAEFQYHHALEPGIDGTFWTVGTAPTEIEGKGWDESLLDDHAVELGPDGEVVSSRSVLEILQTAGLLNRVYDYDVYQADPIHLNDVQPVLEDGEVARRGDIYLSLGHLNMVMLFRPATDEVVWWSQDRIMHQHDIDLIGPDTISVFDNRRKTASDGEPIVIGTNEIVEYKLPDTKARVLVDEPLAGMEVRTMSQGLSDVVPGSGMMVEETVWGRLVKFGDAGAPDWIFVNKSDDGRTWTMNWSRYVPNDIGDAAVESLEEASCEG